MFRTLTRLGAMLAAFALAGCFPPDADFRFGVSTSEILGAVEAPGDPPLDPGDVLVIVFQHHYLLQTYDSEERVFRVSADLRRLSRTGEFRVPLPSDVAKVELIVIAPDRLTGEFRFSRQIGIGQVMYHPTLLPHRGWYSHFYTYVQPMLSNLITEDRYQLSQEDQQRLGDWLQYQADRMQALRRAQAPRDDADAPDDVLAAPPETDEPLPAR